MSYEPTVWKTGDAVTKDSLNNMENGVNDVDSRYTPTVWNTGDIVTASKLNKLEQGVANANPNRVQTIEGNLSVPWTGLDYLELLDAIINGAASIIAFEFDASALGYGKITNSIFPSDNGLISNGCSGSSFQLGSAFSLDWGGLGSLVFGVVYDSAGQGTNLTSYASLIPTKINIIWHPLPESED